MWGTRSKQRLGIHFSPAGAFAALVQADAQRHKVLWTDFEPRDGVAETPSQTLNRLLARHPRHPKQARLALPRAWAMVRELLLPPAPKVKLRMAVEGMIEDQFHIPASQLTWDMEILGQEDGKLNCLLLVVKTAVVEKRVQTLQECGLELAGLDFLPFSDLRALRRASLPAKCFIARLEPEMGHVICIENGQVKAVHSLVETDSLSYILSRDPDATVPVLTIGAREQDFSSLGIPAESGFLTALGLALPGEGTLAVNLVPGNQGQEGNQLESLLWKTTVGLAAVSAVFYFCSGFYISHLEKERRHLRAEVRKLSSTLEARRNQRTTLETMFNPEEARRYKKFEALSEISKVLPKSARVQSLSFLEDGIVQIQAQAKSDQAVSVFAEQLDRSPVFEEVALVQTAKAQTEGRDLTTFELAAKLGQR